MPIIRSMIPFNKPFLAGSELVYIRQAIESGHASGNGGFTKRCHAFFENQQAFKKVLLTSSCTDALEMAALLAELEPGDEVIVPSYTFVSTANAFLLRGARIVFADSCSDSPHICPQSIAAKITERTKAIVVVHYGGVACRMDEISALANQHGILLIEDAAHALESFYCGSRLGSLGNLGAFSFHETKNINCGEGGLLIVNDERFIERSEIIWEKGTNRTAFARGESKKYEWIDVGSSFLASDITAAFLLAQLEQIDLIQKKRITCWHRYSELLRPLADQGKIGLLKMPDYATVNGHLFYVLCSSFEQRSALIKHLQLSGIMAVFHYLPLHLSPYYVRRSIPEQLPNAERYGQCLLRLPLYFDLTEAEQDRVIQSITDFYNYSECRLAI